MNAPALAAEQLQWTPYLDHVSSTVSVCAIGATVMRDKALADLPADLKQTFFDLEKRLQKVSANRVRKLDAASYQRISRKMKIVDTTPADREAWRKVLVRAVKRLSQGTYDRGLIDRVLHITGKR